MGTEVLGSSWGTWEELLLGGAVLRHGTRDWDVVASELRARTISPYVFTPEVKTPKNKNKKVCKAKYEDLQQRYSGSSAWFEELKKKRVAELKRALEQSENSIGSLESKLESLKAEKKDKKERDNYDDAHNNNNNESGGVEEVRLEKKLERVESSTKETSSKDGLSAGSFTHETTRTNWSPCDETKPEASHSCGDEYEKVSNVVIDMLAIRGSTVKKRRGKRKRKDCSTSYNNNGKETSVGDSEFLLDSSSTGDVVALSGCKEHSTTNNVNNCGVEDQDQSRSFLKEGVDFFMQILDSVLEIKVASAFRRRLDSQKRGRYKKMIRRHMDLDTIRSRISSKSIKSTKELFRDLLLLTNNALVFYSKTTREYKSALLLRDHVTTKLRSSILPTQQLHNVSVIKIHAHNNNASVKPRSVRPGNRKIVAAKVDGGSINSTSKKSGGKLNSNINLPPSSSLSPESLPLKKKRGIGRPKKVGRGSTGHVPVMGVKGKRRVRAK